MAEPSGRRFPGIHAVLYALFDRDERLDRAAMRRQVELVLAAGVDGIVVLGLATEVTKLGEREQRDLVEWALHDVAGRAPVGVTVQGGSIAAQLARLHDAERAGADWLILQPPTGGSYSGPELTRGFRRLADAARVPTAVQTAPSLMGAGLDVGGIAALATECPNLTHVKAELPVVAVAELAAAGDTRLVILGGQGGLEMTDALRAGCAGFVLAPDMVDHAVRIWRRWQEGDEDGAEAAYRAVLPEIVFAMRSLEHLVTYGKRIFAHRAGLVAHDRAPIAQPSAFGLACAVRHAAALGPFGARPC
jgi:2-keto-3-deoxy-L-arabinonate dehydratase